MSNRQPTHTAQLYDDIDDRLRRMRELAEEQRRIEEELAWAELERRKLLGTIGKGSGR